MTNKSRIIFMGTPDFAAHILENLIEKKYNVVAVITVPDKQAGRGRKVQESAVKKAALKHNLPILQPVSLRDEQFLTDLKSYNADIQVVVAFRMLPKLVWDMPKKGTFNLHASLLPLYRGAAPINWAIINGETHSGVTTFFIDEKIDTGAMILQSKIELDERETASTLHDKLMIIGVDAVCNTIDLIEKGNVQTTPQPQIETTPAPKIHKETCCISWNKSVEEVDRFVRGMTQYPGAWAMLKHKDKELIVKIYNTTPISQGHNIEIGKIIVENKTIKVAVQDGFIQLDELQLPSKKRMFAKDLLNGFTFDKDDMFYNLL